MSDTNGTSAVANRQAENAAIVAVSDAGTKAAANGGGDIAVLNARKEELQAIRDRARKLATIERTAAFAKADVWGRDSKRGATMVANAEETYSKAVREANETYHASLALFTVREGFAAMMPEDQRNAVFGHYIASLVRPLAEALTNASNQGIETLDAGNGTVYNVAALLGVLNASAAIVETSDDSGQS